MIISKTPYRISLFGGGTDFPAWYQRHGGCVIAATIDKYCYLSCRYLPPFFDIRYRMVWSNIENCVRKEEIRHPAIRAAIEFLNIEKGLEIHHIGDLPARSGMGSSSAFTVGLLHGLHALQGRMINKYDLTMEAIHLEQNVLQEAVGSQDQVCAAYGGLNKIDFLQNGEISVAPVTVSRERVLELQQHLMLFYTGIKRTSSEVAETFVNNLEAKKRQLRIMKDLVDEAVHILNSGQDITQFGELLGEAWDAKCSLSKMITNPEIDAIYREALDAGAMSGKLTGAGGGGFLLLFVPPEKRNDVKKALARFIHVPFNFEFTGSQIIFAADEEDYTGDEAVRSFHPVRFRELSELQDAAAGSPDSGGAVSELMVAK